MKQEKKCKAVVNGTVHNIRIDRTSKKYNLYVDEEQYSELWLSASEENQEKDVLIDGKVCQFVLYDDEPDLAVDGILQFAEAEYQKTRRFHKRVAFFGGISMTLVGLMAFFFGVMFMIAGEGIFGGWLSIAMIAGFILAGIWLVLYSRKKEEY